MEDAIRTLVQVWNELLLELADEMDDLETNLRTIRGEALVERATAIRDLEFAMREILNTIQVLEDRK